MKRRARKSKAKLVVMTADEIRAVARKLREERERIMVRLKQYPSILSDHDWIALRGKEEGMLYASAVYMEALVAKEEASQIG